MFNNVGTCSKSSEKASQKQIA